VSTRRLVLAAAAGAIFLVLFLFARRKAGVTGENHDNDVAERLASLEKAAAEASGRVAILEHRASASRTRPTAPAASGTGSENTAAHAELPAPPRGRTDRELAEAFSTRFLVEVVDPSWARQAEREYRASIDAKLPETSRILSFECRSEFCRMEVIHDSVTANNGFLRSLFAMELDGPLRRNTGGFRAAVPTETPDGKLAYTVYIARPGTPLALDP